MSLGYSIAFHASELYLLSTPLDEEAPSSSQPLNLP